MKQSSDPLDPKKKEKKDKELRMAVWMCAGMGAGVLVGKYLLYNPFLGLSMGLVLGLFIGNLREKAKEK